MPNAPACNVIEMIQEFATQQHKKKTSQHKVDNRFPYKKSPQKQASDFNKDQLISL